MKVQSEKEEKKKEKLQALVESIQTSSDDDLLNIEDSIQLDDSVVKSRLKKRGEPIIYFGEGDEDRLARLLKLEERKPFNYDSSAEAQKSFLEEIRKENEAFEEDPLIRMQRMKEAEDLDFKIEDREPENKHEEVLFFLREQLEEMRQELENMSEDVKRSESGLKELLTFQQTRINIKPFFSDCRTERVQEDLFLEVYEIVKSLKEGNFVTANDAYYRMSIGNSPWPMGVANVDIHPRTARERIATAQTAHILNDERQRKYIHSIKRIMTHYQYHHPTKPSLSVM